MGPFTGPYCSAFANLPWLLSVLPRRLFDRRRCSAVAGASVIANPTPVALRSAVAFATLIRLLAAGGDQTGAGGLAGRGGPMATSTVSYEEGTF